ncbi:serine/threonine-protein kinase OXI1-like [Andrographis paniculata]|uniref:serine/threonine-protein kinase OXI1-like n=1 Tax=Andrographis paniculata TaxID=175694 RepID=UPI0021E902DF|nr:serine/threonine-protein kinase OXI1-like [Andrographis paniculata]
MLITDSPDFIGSSSGGRSPDVSAMLAGGFDQDPRALDLKNIKVISALGRGAKGVVFLVKTANGELLALKAILRSSVEKKLESSSHGNEYRRVRFERDVLASFNHPLLPKLHGVLETEKLVGYAIDYCSGRDLNYLRKKQTEKMFSDDIIRFYAAELVLALEYLHNSGIVYRDLKPENVMIQENGHLMLVDFDLSTKLSSKSPENRPISFPQPKPQINPKKKKKKKKQKHGCFFQHRDSEISPDDSVQLGEELRIDSLSSRSDSVEKSNSFVGTEEYVAPEVILGHGHDFSVDWWCLGVMLYEMLYGTTPFRGANRKETFYRVISKTPDLTGELTPLRDLIGKLLDKDPRRRISVREIKSHCFFAAVDWDAITEMPRPPFIPELTDVEGMEGNKDIDVENYVQRVFKNGQEKIDNTNFEEEKKMKNSNKHAWVNGQNHPTKIHNDNFLIF